MPTCLDVIKNSVSASLGKEGLEYDVNYTVVFDGPADPSLALVAYAPNGKYIPRYADKYPRKLVGPEAYVTSISAAAADADSTKYRVAVKFTPNDPNSEKEQEAGGDSPEADTFVLPRNKVRWGKAAYTFESDRDRVGKIIANSAGIFYKPPHQFTDSFDAVTITNFSKEHDPLKYKNIGKKCNKSVFLGRDPATWLIDDFTAEPMEFVHKDGSIDDYWQYTFTLLWKPDGWKRFEILDQGTEQLEDELSQPIKNVRPPGGGALKDITTGDESGEFENDRVIRQRKAITDEGGQPTSSAVPLNGKGKACGPNDTPTFLHFIDHEDISFNELGIDYEIKPVGPRTPQ
jgi:hypothetical protein